MQVKQTSCLSNMQCEISQLNKAGVKPPFSAGFTLIFSSDPSYGRPVCSFFSSSVGKRDELFELFFPADYPPSR